MEFLRKVEAESEDRMSVIVEAGALAIVSNVEPVPISKYDIPSNNESSHCEAGEGLSIIPLPPSPKMPSRGNTNNQLKLIKSLVLMTLFATSGFVMWKGVKWRPLHEEKMSEREKLGKLRKEISEAVVRSDLSDFPMESYAKYLQLAIKFMRSEPTLDSDGLVTLETLELIEKILAHDGFSFEKMSQLVKKDMFRVETKSYLRTLQLRTKSWWDGSKEKEDGNFEKLFSHFPVQMGIKRYPFTSKQNVSFYEDGNVQARHREQVYEDLRRIWEAYMIGKEGFSREIIDDEGNVRSDLSDFPLESYAEYLKRAIKFIRSEPLDSDGQETLKTLELIEKLLEHYDLSYEGVRQDTNEFVKETKCYLRKLDLRKKSWWNDLEKKDGKFKKLFLCYPVQMGLKKNDGKFENLSSHSPCEKGLREEKDLRRTAGRVERSKLKKEQEPIGRQTRQEKIERRKEKKEKKRQEKAARDEAAKNRVDLGD